MYYGYGGLIGLVIFILDIVAIIEILKSSKDTLGKVLWTLFIIVFPLLGVIIYYLFGRQK